MIAVHLRLQHFEIQSIMDEHLQPAPACWLTLHNFCKNTKNPHKYKDSQGFLIFAHTACRYFSYQAIKKAAPEILLRCRLDLLTGGLITC